MAIKKCQMEYSNSPNDILVLYYLLLTEGVVTEKPYLDNWEQRLNSLFSFP